MLWKAKFLEHLEGGIGRSLVPFVIPNFPHDQTLRQAESRLGQCRAGPLRFHSASISSLVYRGVPSALVQFQVSTSLRHVASFENSASSSRPTALNLSRFAQTKCRPAISAAATRPCSNLDSRMPNPTLIPFLSTWGH